MSTVYAIYDGKLPLVPFSAVLGEEWEYEYSDSWKGVEFNVYSSPFEGSVAVDCSTI